MIVIIVIEQFTIFRYEKALQDKEKVEDELKRRPPPTNGPQLPSTVSISLFYLLGHVTHKFYSCFGFSAICT